MGTDVQLLECVGCGAPLEFTGDAKRAGLIECTYCGRALIIQGVKTTLNETASAKRTLTDDLLRGFTGTVTGGIATGTAFPVGSIECRE